MRMGGFCIWKSISHWNTHFNFLVNEKFQNENFILLARLSTWIANFSSTQHNIAHTQQSVIYARGMHRYYKAINSYKPFRECFLQVLLFFVFPMESVWAVCYARDGRELEEIQAWSCHNGYHHDAVWKVDRDCVSKAREDKGQRRGPSTQNIQMLPSILFPSNEGMEK